MWFTVSIVVGAVELVGAASLFKSGYADKNATAVADAGEQAGSGMNRINTAISSPPVQLATHIPWIGAAIENSIHTTNAANNVVQAAVPLAQNFDPNIYRDGQINLKAMDALLAELPQLNDAINRSEQDMRQIANFGPASTLFVRAQTEGLAYLNLAGFVTEKVAPQRQAILNALGANGPQRYMVAFENPAQLRAPGGAPLSATILQFDNGLMTIPFNGYINGDAFKGHPLIQYKPASPPPWGATGAGLGYVNSGAHPDWRLAGEDLIRAWNAAKDPKVSAMIGMDTRAIEALIRATGPIEVEGYGTLTADNFAQKVVTDAYLDFENDQDARQGLNDQVAKIMIGRLMSGDLRTLAQASVALLAEAPGRHFQARFQQPELQQLALDAWAAGEVFMTSGNDTVGVFSRNRNMSKVDVYSDRRLVSNVTINADGSATVEQRLTVTNNVPADLDTAEKIGYTTAWSANEWFFYQPLGATEQKLSAPEGYTQTRSYPDGLGRTVTVTEGMIAPQQTAELVFSYRMPAGSFRQSDQPYRYQTQLNPQPMQQQVELEINVRIAEGASCNTGTDWQAASDGASFSGQQSIRRTLSLECS